MRMLFSFLLCLMLPLSAHAQNIRSLAVLPAQSVGLDESIAEIFNEVFVAELSKMTERKIITMRDIEAMLGFEQTKQAFDCSDMSCLAEIGGSLGVDELLYPRVTGIGDELMLSFTLMDVAKAAVLARSSITIENEPNEYRDAATQVLDQLWKAAGVVSTPIQPAPKAVPVATAKATESAASSLGAPSTWSWVMMGSGAAMLGAGTYFGLDAQSKYDLARTGGMGSQAAIDSGKQSALMTNVLIGVGALALSVGVSLWLFVDGAEDKNPSESALSLVPFASPDASGVLLQGSFQ